jgi:hypothetical protein
MVVSSPASARVLVSRVHPGFPEDLSLTTIVSDVHDPTWGRLFDKPIPGAPDPCGSLRMGLKQAFRVRKDALFR